MEYYIIYILAFTITACLLGFFHYFVYKKGCNNEETGNVVQEV